ncbi:unnamed protein product [Protopolystoma xenopodis]|uniref:Uncharacterized protein n=1 Tax=Protopolystoma xenopodis TaxID=117903 RepID=A0A448XGR7_9PLAT|nr:unnamed protein product [Protopolystoma xenopodis]
MEMRHRQTGRSSRQQHESLNRFRLDAIRRWDTDRPLHKHISFAKPKGRDRFVLPGQGETDRKVELSFPSSANMKNSRFACQQPLRTDPLSAQDPSTGTNVTWSDLSWLRPLASLVPLQIRLFKGRVEHQNEARYVESLSSGCQTVRYTHKHTHIVTLSPEPNSDEPLNGRSRSPDEDDGN